MSKISYKDAGVNVEKGQEAVTLIKEQVKETFNDNVLSGIGAFAGFYRLGKDLKSPVLVTGTDGVGTKLLLAREMDEHETIGQDLVAMCVNDILCHGAKPLFFLDYIATGHLDPQKISTIVGGIAKGCKAAGLALIGGETAEMPGMYGADDYDLAGFVVGVVDEEKIIDGKDIQPGDVIIGLSSSGVHSNGYSLVRKLFLEEYPEAFEAHKEDLIKPTLLYTKAIHGLLEEFTIKGIAHITGGGFYENVPRMLPSGVDAVIKKDSWRMPPIFDKIRALSGLEDEELYATFNMGIGMMLVVDEQDREGVVAKLKQVDYEAYEIGHIRAGSQQVSL